MHKKILLLLVGCALLLVFLNMPVTYQEGIDYKLYTRTIPLYIKSISFIERDYYYKALVSKVTKTCSDDTEKILSIFDWTRKNIYSGVPPPLQVKDDHVWNIAIRGYATPDQSADIFATLCTYAGFPAAVYVVSPKEKKSYFPVAVVYNDGRYLLFDAYNGNYFINEDGQIADIDDMIRDYALAKSAKNKPTLRGIAYEDYFNNLVPLERFDKVLRAQLQMPLPRLWYEIRLRLGFIKKPAQFAYGERLE